MRKSLLKTPPSELSSRLVPAPAALLGVGAARRPAGSRNGSARYTGVPRVRVEVGETVEESVEEHQLTARLRLLEGFVSRTDLNESAQLGLFWLRDVLGLVPSLCLVRPLGDPALSVVAAQGFDGSAVSSFAVPVEDWND